MTFMSMVKHAAIIKTDDRRGFDLTEASSGNSHIHLCNTCDIKRLKPAVSFYDSPQSRRFSSLVLEGGYCIRCIHWGVLQGHDVRLSNAMGYSLAESILRVFTPPHVLRVHSTPWPISLPLETLTLTTWHHSSTHLVKDLMIPVFSSILFVITQAFHIFYSDQTELISDILP